MDLNLEVIDILYNKKSTYYKQLKYVIFFVV
jgi:hypothetical protein